MHIPYASPTPLTNSKAATIPPLHRFPPFPAKARFPIRGIRFVLLSPVIVAVTMMEWPAGYSNSWSAVGSHGQCRPAGGRPDDTLARGFLFLALHFFRALMAGVAEARFR